MAGTGFGFGESGIGELLKGGRLHVPPNQRSYAWREKHVRYLIQDLNEAINKKEGGAYFLGTIVLIQESPSKPRSIVDGQQRLATSTILLARIRDALLDLNREESARAVERDFLTNVNRRTEKPTPKLTLNLEDNDYFASRILERDATHKETPTKRSNQRLRKASLIAKELVTDLTKHLSKDASFDLLQRWMDFLESQASVLVITVPDEVGAYRMFETLNDRGLRASQADILKNSFYGRAGSRLPEAIMLWNGITSTLDPLASEDREYDDEEDIDKNDLLITYIRHLWITKHGQTKARDLAGKIKEDIPNEDRSMDFLTEAAEAVHDYAALWSASHPKWTKYKPSTRQSIETIALHLQVEQIKPLLFAVARKFSIEEADKAFRLFVSWSVRFLIYGGRGGMLDTQYSLRAQEVGTGKITTAAQLRDKMKDYVPSDGQFEEAFATARVSRPTLARYYLRALEKTSKGIEQPEWVPNEEVSDITLEHVLPLRPSPDWKINEDDARTGRKLLGNMAIIPESANRDLGQVGFAKKRAVFSKFTYDLTKQIANYEDWNLSEIRNRQKKLAKLAPRTWPIDLKKRK